MSYESTLKSISLLAGEAMSGAGYQFRYLKMATAAVVRQTANTIASIGVLQNNPGNGEVAQVAISGISMIEAGAAVTAGVEVMSDSSGRVIAHTGATARVTGIALSAAAAAGDLIPVLFLNQAVTGS